MALMQLDEARGGYDGAVQETNRLITELEAFRTTMVSALTVRAP